MGNQFSSKSRPDDAIIQTIETFQRICRKSSRAVLLPKTTLMLNFINEFKGTSKL